MVGLSFYFSGLSSCDVLMFSSLTFQQSQNDDNYLIKSFTMESVNGWKMKSELEKEMNNFVIDIGWKGCLLDFYNKIQAKL